MGSCVARRMRKVAVMAPSIGTMRKGPAFVGPFRAEDWAGVIPGSLGERAKNLFQDGGNKTRVCEQVAC